MDTGINEEFSSICEHKSLRISEKEYPILKDLAESYGISDTEYVVLKLVSSGLSQKEIADIMKKSTKTIDNHINNIKIKTGLSKNTELIALYASSVKGKKFDLKLLRQYSISIFILLVNVCRPNLT